MHKIVAWIVFAWVVIALPLGVFAHPDIEEEGLLFQFAPGGHPIKDGKLDDITHHVTATVEGSPTIGTVGPTEAFILNGSRDWFSIAKSIEEAKPLLPAKAITVSAWVNVKNQYQDWGGICGLFQDNGNSEQGWILSYHQNRFVFALASQGHGRLTYLTGKSEVEAGRWYYVVATYDGKKMQLFVNGVLDGESLEQSGDILYPAQGTYNLGAYKDSNEQSLFGGAIYEVKVYDRVLDLKEVQEVATKNNNLISATSTAELAMVAKPYLQFGTQTSMTILCETSRPTKMTVEYTKLPPLSRTFPANTVFKPVSVDGAAQRINELTLTELEPNTTYFYRVTCVDDGDEKVASEARSFQTAPLADMPWAFTIIGDTQRNPEVTRKCAEAAYALRPNFMLHCGDVVDNGYAKNQWLKDLLEPMHPLMAHVPLFPVIGNHEGNSHWYYDYFSLPKPEYYYTFTYGNAQFFMIDSNKPLGEDSEQYKWLDEQLGKSKATWKITCHHHPCFSSYGDGNGTGEKGEAVWGDANARKLIPLYEKHGVDFSFNGHMHNYERTWPIQAMTINQKKGVRYITSGGGGGYLEPAAPQRAWFSLHYKEAYHICYATIHDRTIQFKAIDLEGNLFDMFELTKPADR